MRTGHAVALATAALVMVAGPAAGQVPGLELTLVPKVGFYSPAADLEAATDAAGRLVDERGGSLAFGLAADLGVPLSPLNVRVGFDYVTASEFTWADTTGAELEEATGEQTMLALAGDVILRPEEQQDGEDQQAAPAPVPRLEPRERDGWRLVGEDGHRRGRARHDRREHAVAEGQTLARAHRQILRPRSPGCSVLPAAAA